MALFRYPLSIPIDILDLAQTVNAASWSAEVNDCDNSTLVWMPWLQHGQ